MNKIYKRNLGIIAHVDAGKTTTTEKMLYFSANKYGKRMKKKPGEVHEGNTTTDFDETEKSRGITIQSASISFDWREYNIQLIDTPGHVDFQSDVILALTVLDGVVLILDAVSGVQAQTKSVFKNARELNIPIISFINKMDRAGADFYNSVKTINEQLEDIAIPMVDPIYGNTFEGFYDLVKMRKIVYPVEIGDDVNAYEAKVTHFENFTNEEKVKIEEKRKHMLDSLFVITLDPEYGELGEEEISDKVNQKIADMVRRDTINLKIIPCFCGSSYKNKCVHDLLDAVCDYLPNPKEVQKTAIYKRPDSEETEVNIQNVNEVSALVYKLMKVKNCTGYVAIVRIYSGIVTQKTVMWDTSEKAKIKVNKIVEVFADKVKNYLTEAEDGSIVGLILSDIVKPGTTISTDKDLHVKGMEIDKPVASVKIRPYKSGEKSKLMEKLAQIVLLTKGFAYYEDQNKDVVLCGPGALALEIKLDKIENEEKIKIIREEPTVVYLERLLESLPTFRCEKVSQTGGRGLFAVLELQINPHPTKVQVINAISGQKGGGNHLEAKFFEGVKRGVENACKRGPIDGRPIEGLEVQIKDCKVHSVDSSDLAFQICADEGVTNALRSNASKISIIEPYVKLIAHAPDISPVVQYLKSNGAKVISVSGEHVEVEVANSKVMNFMDILRNRTSGQGSFNMSYMEYRPVKK